MKYITIVGSRNITGDEFTTLREVATRLSYLGYILRSGAADGADSTINHLHNVEIIIPWDGFNNHTHDGKRVFAFERLPNTDLAKNKAREIHPRPDKLIGAILKFHSRNIYQIIGPLGLKGVKSDMVIYCTDDVGDEPVGGTRTAVMYGRQLNIPTFNTRGQGNDAGRIIETILGRMNIKRKLSLLEAIPTKN